MSMQRFKIIIPSYNCSEWIDKCLLSLENQKFKKYDVCIIDDASTQKEQREIILQYCKKNRWKHLFNKKNRGVLHNIVEGIKNLNPKDEDVIIQLDGDDWLYNEEVLEKLYETYNEKDIYLTYGREIHYPDATILPMRDLPNFVIENNMFREHPWIFSSPKTFKYILWKHIIDQDLRDENGEYYRISGDVAYMLPMLEMAGSRIAMMEDILYVYNRENPISHHKIYLEKEKSIELFLRKQKKYKKLPL